MESYSQIKIIRNPPYESYCEDINEDVFIRKDEQTGEVIGIGILNFKEHTKDLKDILIKGPPVKINFESIETKQN